MMREGGPGARLSLSRRAFLRLTGAGLLAGITSTACTPAARPQAVSEAGPRFGGTLRVAIAGEPPALDPTFTTAYITRQIALHMFELLLHQDGRFNPVPMLASAFAHEEQGRVLRLELRTGVKFHNRKPMTADDVVASLLRYARMTGYGRTLFGRVADVAKSGDYAVRLVFKEPTAVAPIFLSAHADAPVIPKELAEAYPDGPLKEFVGTGPYRFGEHLPDRYVSLKRYQDYAAVDLPPSGNSGRKVAYLHEIRFIPVPEPSVRLDGLATGEFDFAQELNPDSYDRLRADPNLEVQVVRTAWYCAHFNKAQESILSSRTLRHALLAAVDAERLARLAFGRPEFYRLYPSMSAPETPWYSEAGKEYYNQKNPDKARRLLREAAYDGRPLRFIATKEYTWNYNLALGLKEQFETVGVKVDLQLMDWAALVRTRSRRDAWDIFITGHLATDHPLTQPFINESWPGFWKNPEKDRLVERLMVAATQAEARQYIDALERLKWEDAAFAMICEGSLLHAYRRKLRGYRTDWFDPLFWSCWLE